MKSAVAPLSTKNEVSKLRECYHQVRGQSEHLCETLQPEDCVIQSMPDASPIKWHLAHTTWFFETFLLAREPGYQPVDSRFGYLFNSYYNAVGERHPRAQRGLLSRPTMSEVFDYRRDVDKRMQRWFDRSESVELTQVVETGLHHEQQHQELMLTDIKHAFSVNPLRPVFRPPLMEQGPSRPNGPIDIDWIPFEAGNREIGHHGKGFCYDNELPRHTVYLRSFLLASRPVTCGEYLQFIDDGGYSRPELWLSDGWDTVQQQRWSAPLYWENHEGQWRQFTLSGMRPIDGSEPVCHISFYEADAFARWSGARLPTEAEWESAAATCEITGNFVDSGRLHPCAPDDRQDLSQMLGDVWEWTASPYVGYPGYRPPQGALGEYNGKFMCNQFVLRGGSCATPQSHIRPTYRNFFQPEKRWQFTGLRLARDA